MSSSLLIVKANDSISVDSLKSGDRDIILSNRLYIPAKMWKCVPSHVRKSLLKEFNKTYISPSTYCDLRAGGRFCWAYQELADTRGAEYADKALCQDCPHAKMKISCAFKKDGIVSFYRGDVEKIRKVIALVVSYVAAGHYDGKAEAPRIIDVRTLSPLKKPFTMLETGDDRSKVQDALAEKYVDAGYGILVAAARFGKTRTACVVASRLAQRTFVLAHQKELLEQFQNNWIKFSTLKASQIKINPSEKEAKKLPVSLFTYQHFLQKHGKKRLEALSKVPGLIIVDEAHRCGALGFTRVVNSFHARYRLGITATPDRKDKLSFRIYNTFGPITAEGGVEMLSCKYKFLETGVIFNDYDRVPHRRRFVYLARQMVKNEERNGVITNRAVRNVEKGHQVLIPVKSVEHVKLLGKMIRERAKQRGFNRFRVCEYSASIVKGKKREEVSQQIRDGYYDVVVAIEGMINVGFDAPRMSSIILNAGTYSFNKENRYQLFSRIRTRCEGKKTPLIDILTDECKWSRMSNKGIQKQMEEFGFIEVSAKGKNNEGKQETGNKSPNSRNGKRSHGRMLNMG